MSTNLIFEIAGLLREKGQPFDFGCNEEDLDQLIQVAIFRYPNKRYRATKDWVVWDLDESDESKKIYKQRGLLTTVLYARNIIFDSSRELNIGDYARSTPLICLEEGCFCVSRNTVYICVGSGMRKTVDPELVNAVYFGS